MFACLAAPAFGAYLPPPEPYPRFSGSAVFTAGKMYAVAGRMDNGWAPSPPYDQTSGIGVKDPGGIVYDSSRSVQNAIYDPLTDTWVDSRWQFDPQAPASLDMTGDAWTQGGEGTYPGANQALAYDALNAMGEPGPDGVQEIWLHGGYPTWAGNWWVYNPPQNEWLNRGTANPPGIFPGGYYAQYMGTALVGKDPMYQDCFLCYGGIYWGNAGAAADKDEFAAYYPPTPLSPDGSWSPLANGPVSAWADCGGVIGNSMYIAGGVQGVPGSGVEAESTAIWEYQMAAGVWVPAPVGNLTQLRSRMPGVVYDGKLYVIGGVTPAPANADTLDVEQWTPGTPLAVVVGQLPMPMSREFAAVDPATGWLYVGEGRHNGNYLDASVPQWWKTNLNVLPLVWQAMTPDPCHFPWQSWDGGGFALTGKVTGPTGKPVPGAIVGIKNPAYPQAAADARKYAVADAGGNYSLTAWPGNWIIAAWTNNYKPSTDVAFVMPAADFVQDVQITTVAGTNLTPGSLFWASTEDGGNPAANAIDQNLGTRWSTPGGAGTDAWYIIDMGVANNLTGITMFWETARPAAYSVDLTTDNPDPVLGGAVWTTVYSMPHLGGGADLGGGVYVDPIGFAAPLAARGVRFHCTAFNSGFNNYSAWEFILHSTTPVPIATVGDVRNLQDGTAVALTPTSVTLAPRLGGNRVEFFYEEDADRDAGIRVQPQAPDNLNVNDLVQVSGTMATTAAGERYIANAVVAPPSGAATVQPLLVNNRTVQEDALIVGELVKTPGKVLDAGDSTYFTINDGYYKSGDPNPFPTRVVIVGDPVSIVALGEIVAVTGVVSLQIGQEGPEKVILYRSVSPVAPPTLANSWCTGFEPPTYVLGALVPQDGWVQQNQVGSGAATVVAAPDPVMGTQSLRLDAPSTVLGVSDAIIVSQPQAGGAVNHLVLSFYVYREEGTQYLPYTKDYAPGDYPFTWSNNLWWYSGDPWGNGGGQWDISNNTWPWAWNGNIPTVTARYAQVVIYLNFVTHLECSWYDGKLVDSYVAFDPNGLLWSDTWFDYAQTQPFLDGDYGKPAHIDNVCVSFD